MIYYMIIYLILVVLIVRSLLRANTLWVLFRKSEEIRATKSGLEKNYQIIKDLY